MDEGNGSLAQRIAAGAAAGLAAGLLASLAMNVFQRLLPAPTDPDDLPATVVTADRICVAMTGQKLAERHYEVAGNLVHYGLGAMLGTLYGVTTEFKPQVALGRGVPFGVGVALLLDEVAVPALAITGPPWKFGPKVHLYSIASHIVFGLSTEYARRTGRSGHLRL